MKKRAIFLLIVLSVFSIFSINSCWAQNPFDDPGQPQPSGFQNPLGGITDFNSLLNKIIEWLINIGTLIAVVMVIYSAILYISSGGKDTQVTTARKSLQWSLVGLAIMLIGQGWVGVIQSFLGVSGVPAGGTTVDSLFEIFKKAVRYIFGFAFAAGLALIIWGGLDWMKAGGDSGKVAEARNKLLYGLIGITIMIGVLTIISVIASFLGVTAPSVF